MLPFPWRGRLLNIMTVFWRKELLSELERDLLSKCLDAHAASVARENISTTVLFAAAKGSGDYTKALTAALATLGGMHAPIAETYDLLQHPEKSAELLDAGKMVPGWGHSFVKGGIDPIWEPLAILLRNVYPNIYRAIDEVTVQLHCLQKFIHPNPSCFTAATGMALRMPKEVVPWLFIHGRLSRWSEIFCNTLAN